jgi:cation diffusion facilitator CzcD-associated flavoprotein CzcO
MLSAATTSKAPLQSPRGGTRAALEHHHVAIIGSGFAGLGMAIRLREAGERDFVVLEKASDLGGTWRDNVYPGCQCDVPSNLYSFSFAPIWSWSRDFAWQWEILDYLRACAERFGVVPHIRFETEVLGARWDEALQRWFIETSRGTLTADVLISGHGGLSAPSIATLPGLDRFRGAHFHSATWDEQADLRGKRVGVIGTGASAIQVVPSIQPEVGRLHVFQRTPAWILPRLDAPFSERKKRWLRRIPLLQRLDRLFLYLVRELLVIALTRRPRWLGWLERVARLHLENQVADPGLRKQLTPRYSIGCKRILLSNEFYPALCQPNAELVTEGIREVVENGIVTNDGFLHELDAIVLCTGFNVWKNPMIERVFGRDGRSLGEHWADSAEAYLGSSVAGFPNLFLLSGPHTGVGHTSLVYMIESQIEYVLGALGALRRREAAVVEVSHLEMKAFCAEMQVRLSGSVWNSGCSSWYLDPQGKNTSMWPTFTFLFRRRAKRFDERAHCFEERRPERSADAPRLAA